jgi:hypothetical protein
MDLFVEFVDLTKFNSLFLVKIRNIMAHPNTVGSRANQVKELLSSSSKR